MAVIATGIGMAILKGIATAAATAGAGYLISEIDWNKLGESIEKYIPKSTSKKRAEEALKTYEENQTANNEPNPTEPTEEKEKTPQIIPNISDTTNENVETSTGNSFNLQKYMKEFETRQEKWMQLQMEREDTAYSRAIADIKRSGVNPNLMGSIQPASSTAIQSMSNMNAEELTELMGGYFGMLEQELQNNWQGDQNSLKNFTNVLTTVFAAIMLFAGKKGG